MQTTAAAKIQAKISTRTLDQISAELVMLGQRKYTAEISILTNAYISNIERRFPDMADAVWEVLDVEGVFMSFADALLIVRDAATV